MAKNRVQFQPGLSLPAFLKQYGAEAACEKALLRARWPDGFVCARCTATTRRGFRREGQTYWQCSVCRHQTSLRSGTLFEHSRLALTLWLTGFAVEKRLSPCTC